MARVEGEQALYDFCAWPSAHCPAALTRWRARLAAMEDLPRLDQLRRLNRTVNALVRYRDDEALYGREDYWASPLEALRGGGDCEDYAIVKFFSLLQLGFSNDRLRIAVVRDRRRKVLHAVLMVDLDNRTFVLDSLHAEPVEHQHMLRYEPIYSVNLEAEWAHVVTDQIRRKFLAQYEQRVSALRPLPGFVASD